MDDRQHGVSSCSQPTIDYDLNDTRSREWDVKIDHMDSYLAELGAGHLRLQEQLKQIKEAVQKEQDEVRPLPAITDRSVEQMVHKLQAKIEDLERRNSQLGSGGVSDERFRFLEGKVGVLQNEVVNSTRLMHFIWNCSQNIAVRVQQLHDSTSTTMHQMSQLRAVFSPSSLVTS
eukprot:2545461-Amphidinium_carterae.3